MPVVKALRYGQVTLPKKFREVLDIQEGDLLEAEVVENKIVLTPKTLVTKNQAWEKVFGVLETVHEKTKHIPKEEAEQDALALIKNARKKAHEKTSESRV